MLTTLGDFNYCSNLQIRWPEEIKHHIHINVAWAGILVQVYLILKSKLSIIHHAM